MTETWRDIPGFEGAYQASDRGRVRSLDREVRTRHGHRRIPGQAIATQPINSGYLIAHLYRENVRTALLVHRLVALAFLEGYDETINHVNGNKQDNALPNLEWASYTDNHLHAVAHGLNKQAVPVVGRSGDTVIGPFPSMSRASVFLGKGPNSTSISKALSGARNSAFGYVWELACLR